MNKINGSTKYYTGKYIETKYGRLTILGQLPAEEINGKRYTYYRVKFDTGYITHAMSSSLYRRQVWDPYFPSVANMGYFGEGVHHSGIQGKQTQEYTCWKSMIQRCYSPVKQQECPTYKGCTVDERWLNFQNFCNDIPHLDGYKEWKASFNKTRWHLDKDKQGTDSKLYSKDTCMFLSQEENIHEMWERRGPNHLTRHTYEGTRLSDGYKEIFRSAGAFKRKYNITGKPHDVAVRKENRTQTCGWDFKILDLKE